MPWVPKFFNDPVYDLEYASLATNHARTAREAQCIARELRLNSASRVLDLACGSGRHALALAPTVAHVVGYDRTARFLKHARERARKLSIRNVTWVRGDMRKLAYRSEFDAAYNYFTAWGYYSDEENLDVLVRVRKALKPGGRFLMEMINRDALVRGFLPRDWNRLSDGTFVLEEGWLDLERGRCFNRRIYLKAGRTRTVEIDHQVPSPDGLVRLFRQAGFVNVRLVSAPQGVRPNMDTLRIAVIGSAPEPRKKHARQQRRRDAIPPPLAGGGRGRALRSPAVPPRHAAG
jgi:ubiquinone/menaquinone biosynthesis C-methylase UbiE